MIQPKTIKVALAGLGAVGRATADLLHNCPNVELVAISARRLKPWMKAYQADFTDSPILLADRADVDVVVDCLSGVNTSYEVVHRALSNAKAVVSSNTMLAAVHGQTLQTVARVQNVAYDWQYAAVAGLPLAAMMAGSLTHPTRITTHMALDVQTVLDRIRIFEETPSAALGMVRQDRGVDASGKHHFARLALLQNMCFGTYSDVRSATPLHLDMLSFEDSILAQHMGGELRLVGEVTAEGISHSVQLLTEADAHRMDALQEYVVIETAEADMPMSLSLPPHTPRSVALGLANSVQALRQGKLPRLPKRMPAANIRPTAHTLFVRTSPDRVETLRRDARWNILQERSRAGQTGVILATHLPAAEVQRVLGEGTLALKVWQPQGKQPAALGVSLRLVS